jgi:hypothetical protein
MNTSSQADDDSVTKQQKASVMQVSPIAMISRREHIDERPSHFSRKEQTI